MIGRSAQVLFIPINLYRTCWWSAGKTEQVLSQMWLLKYLKQIAVDTVNMPLSISTQVTNILDLSQIVA